jgi:hypothetical protein
MTETEIRQLEERLKPSFYESKMVTYIDALTGEESMRPESAIVQRMKDPLWIKAFEEYNSETCNQLGLGCQPCYMKVLLYHKWKLKQNG